MLRYNLIFASHESYWEQIFTPKTFLTPKNLKVLSKLRKKIKLQIFQNIKNVGHTFPTKKVWSRLQRVALDRIRSRRKLLGCFMVVIFLGWYQAKNLSKHFAQVTFLLMWQTKFFCIFSDYDFLRCPRGKCRAPPTYRESYYVVDLNRICVLLEI